MKLGLHHFISGLSAIMAIAGAILNIAYFSDTTFFSITVYHIGITFHLVSLGITLLMNSYIGRYLSGLQHNRSKSCWKSYHSTVVYVMASFYWFFCMVYLALIADSHNRGKDLGRIDSCSLGFIIYFASSLVLWYWTVVFKPAIPNLFYVLGLGSHNCYLPPSEKRENNRNKHGWFVNLVLYDLFYEDSSDVKESNVSSSATLLTIFCISVAYMNSSFAIFFNNRFYHDVMVGLTTGSTILAMLLQSLIFLAHYKGTNTLDGSMYSSDMPGLFGIWILFASIWLVVSVIVAFVRLPYDGIWKIDNNFVETSMQCNIFYMVQASPIIPLTLVGLVFGIYYLIKGVRWCCCTQLSDEIRNAKNTVSGYTIKFDDTQPIEI